MAEKPKKRIRLHILEEVTRNLFSNAEGLIRSLSLAKGENSKCKTTTDTCTHLQTTLYTHFVEDIAWAYTAIYQYIGFQVGQIVIANKPSTIFSLLLFSVIEVIEFLPVFFVFTFFFLSYGSDSIGNKTDTCSANYHYRFTQANN